MTTHNFDPHQVATDALSVGSDPIEAVLQSVAMAAGAAADDDQRAAIAQAAADWIRKPGVPLPYGQHQAQVPPGHTLVVALTEKADAATFTEALATERAEWEKMPRRLQRGPRTVVFDGAAVRMAFLLENEQMRRSLQVRADGEWS